MKKTTKKSPMMKIVSAAAMLAVSASMLATSTYAWFSMNDTVSVSGLNLTAKSNDTYLLISQTNTTYGAIQTEGLTSQTVTLTDAEVYPASPALTSAEANYLTVAAGHYTTGGDLITTAGTQVVSAATAADEENWFTANANAVNAATIKTASAKQLTTFDDYVIVDDYYLTVAAGSNPANALTVTASIAAKDSGTDAQAVKLLVVDDDGGFVNLYTAGNDGSAHDANLTGALGTSNITNTSVRHVTVYIYYDGDEAPVYTNNAANLKGADITLTFNASPVEPS